MNNAQDNHQKWKNRETAAAGNSPEDKSGACLSVVNIATTDDLYAYVANLRAYYGIDTRTWEGLGSDARIALAVP
jgi:hypothetical protein